MSVAEDDPPAIGAKGQPEGTRAASACGMFESGLDDWQVVDGQPERLETQSKLGQDEVPGLGGGVLELEAAFESPSETVQVAATLPRAVDLTDTRVRINVRLEKGCATGSSPPCSARLFVKSTPGQGRLDELVFAGGVTQNLTGKRWQALGFAPGIMAEIAFLGSKRFDAKHVLQVGVEVATNRQGSFVPAIVYIDNCSFEHATDTASDAGLDEKTQANPAGGGDSPMDDSCTGTSCEHDGGTLEPPADAPVDARPVPPEPEPDPLSFDFGRTVQAWEISYSEPRELADTASLTWDDTQSDPDDGALRIDVPFDGVDQKVSASYFPARPYDFGGRTVSARVHLESGLHSTTRYPGGAKLFLKSGSASAYVDGGWTNLVVGEWQELHLVVDDPVYDATGEFDSAQVIELGVEVATGGMGRFQAAVVYIDDVLIE